MSDSDHVRALAKLNEGASTAMRLRKFREEALEAAVEVGRDVDPPQTVHERRRQEARLLDVGVSMATLEEIADVAVTIDVLLLRQDVGPLLRAAITQKLNHVTQRMNAGELDCA